MSHTGAEAADRDEDARVVQIYPRLSEDLSATYCPLQVGAGDTVRSVVSNAVVTLGLNAKQTYSLLEVREGGGEERTLESGDNPLERVLMWPPEAQKWHQQKQGYYFILQLQARNADALVDISEDDYDDLCGLPILTEDKILEALRQRFYKRKIYTYAGNVLIAINPNKFLPVYYNPKYMKMYENQPLGSLSPHIFAIADVAYRAMLNKRVNQCVVITGQSGSGKTESSSYLIHCLTALSQRTYSCGLERTILGAGPVLEAFGNAKTAKNNNSSCFGKFIQLNYLENGVIRGAVIQTYLLEKCRLVFRDKSERNYHVFYYLLVGASREEQQEFQLLELQDYHYLKQENIQLDDEEKLEQEYKRLNRAMEMVGFLAPTKKQIFSVLSAMLYLGNLTYTVIEDSGVLEVGPADVLNTLSELLMVKKELLVEALTKRRRVVAKDTAVSHFTLQEATTARDSLAESLYNALFDWIVLHVNHALLNSRDMEDSVSCLSFGIVDMFGFENLQTNSFEQLCINYTSEKLQQFINQHIFKHEQEEYESEGIAWHHISYTDNIGCIQLIDGPTAGVFQLLEEECDLPQPADDNLLDRLRQQHQGHLRFVATAVTEPAFVIQHFAGRVKYHIKDFHEKNQGSMRPEFVSLLRRSQRSFLHHLVASSPEAQFRWGVLRSTIRILTVFKQIGRRRSQTGSTKRVSLRTLKEYRQKSTVDRLSSHSWTLDFSFDRSDECPVDVFCEDIFTSFDNRKKSRAGKQKQLIPKKLVGLCSLKHVVGLTRYYQATTNTQQKKKPPRRSARFQASLCRLLETIAKAEPFFICCISSSAEKKELHFDDEFVLHQIQYTDMLKMVQIQKCGYSAKYTFKEFVEKYRMLLPKGAAATPENITKLFERMSLDQTSYQIGKTKVFLKEKQRQQLQRTLKETVIRHIITLQRWIRSYLLRMHFLQKKDAAMLIQRSWREFYEKHNRAATVIQSAWRSSLKKQAYEREKESGKEPSKTQRGRQSSLTKRELHRQKGLEVSPSRHQQLDPVNSGESRPAQGSRSRERQAGISPPPLTRPFSIPLDHKCGGDGGSTSPSQSSSLQRYSNSGDIKEKADRWREKRSEDESSPDTKHKEKVTGFQGKGKSLSVDELSKINSSGSDDSPTSKEVTVRLRKQHKRRRLAYTRSSLMVHTGRSKESEYWSFPLPPIIPQGPNLKNSASTMDVRAYKFAVKLPAEPDGLRFSLPVSSSNEGSDQHQSNQSQPTTPERLSFLSRFWKKRTPRSPQVSDSSPEKSSTSPRHMPQSYQLPNQNSDGMQRNPTIRISRGTRREQWNASLDREITSTKELQNLDEFLGTQVYDLSNRENELSPTESIFLSATMQFRETIKSMYSVPKPQIGYKDLMKGYRNKVNSLAKPKQKAEVSLVVNLFQSVLDGFIRGELKRSIDYDPVKATKKTKKRRKKDKCPDSPLGHMFSTYQVNIMQSCDLCGSYIWGMEKAYMCSACKLICHKKCLTKIITDCSTRCDRQDENTPGCLHFGVQVCVLTNKTNPVPKVVDLLLMHVEMNGLYTEGIYRKSGSAGRARELHQILETDPEGAPLENYPIHTVSGLLKRWLRELPDPLMTFSLYSDFLRAVELPEKSERIRAVYQKIDELPPSNFNTLERLVFHLVKVAKEEEYNKMSPNSLAIVFAPCILRSPDTTDPFLGMKDVPRTTLCVEILINEQFRRYKEKMQNIQVLEHAQALAVTQLKLKRQNTIVEKASELDAPLPTVSDKETERSLMERIKSIKQEKEDLACRLPDFEHEHTDDDDDNMDSEWSVSSESLDQQKSQDSEGKVTMQRKRLQKPTCPPKPPDLAERVKSMIEGTVVREGQPGHNTVPEQDNTFTSSQDGKPQLAYNIVNGSLDDLDIPYIDEDD
ncbi:unconventional myosin-IXb isoform X2 [Genypterus blacodes]|uniref:unconventional myosin-IXb isoform X2 n=1 Tax=Genypterus blacodes TaxID=154954 RepID=UPI003F7772EC